MPKLKEVSLGQVAQYRSNSYSIMGRVVSYNPSNISNTTYDEMRRYSTIVGALGVVKHPISSVDWYISGTNKERVKFVEKCLRNFFPEFLNDLLMAFDFGWSGFEKVWEIKDSKVILKKLVPLSCYSTYIKVTKDGSFNGLTQEIDGKPVDIPPEKSFVFTNQKEYGNFYGIPRIRGAYTPWYVSRYIIEFANNFFEKYSSPQLIGYAPATKIRYQGRDVDAIDHMCNLLKAMQNSSATVLPHTGGKRDELKYFVDKLESERTGGDFISYLNWLEKQMFVGTLVPALSFSEGEKGSHALFTEQASLFAQEVDGVITMIKHHIDKYIVKQLIEYNFGDSDKDDTQWAYQSLAKRDKELTRQIMFALVQNGKIDIAVKYLSDALGMPAIETGELIEHAKTDVKEKEAGAKEKNSTGMTRFQMMRKPNKMESHVNFERIKDRFEKGEKHLEVVMLPILMKQKESILKDIQKAIEDKRVQDIQNIELRHKGEYQNSLKELTTDLFEGGFDDVVKENDLDISIPGQAKAWVNAQTKNISKKHLGDLEFATITAALYGISKDLGEKQIIKDAGDSFDSYIDKELKNSNAIIVQKYLNDGREWAAETGELEWAEWSAVLDRNTCEYCAGRDGMTISVSDPDFTEFSPGNVHENCRCFTNPRTKIYTINGWKNIKNIKIGEEVLTHKGRFRKVNHVFNKGGYKGDIYKIYIKKSDPKKASISVNVTPEHPFYILRNNIWEWIESKDLKIGDEVGFLGHACARCGKLTKYDKKYCNRSCLSKTITEKQWKNPKHRKNMSNKISKSMINQYKNNLRNGKSITEKAHERTREMVKENIHSFQNPANIKKALIANSKSRHGSFSEKKIAWLIDQLGYEFKKQYIVKKGKDKLGRQRYYYLDFGNPKLKIAIEVDGEYWHKKRIKEDKKRDEFLQKKGWTILRLPSNLVKENLKECSERIQKVYMNHTHQEQFVTEKITKIIKQKGCWKGNRRYNLSVEEDQSFVANGFVVHNCIWVFLKDFQGEQTWKTPSKRQQEEFYMFDRREICLAKKRESKEDL